MKTRSLCLTQAEADELQEAYRHCSDAAAKIRYQAVRLYAAGYSVEQIQDICGCSTRSLLNWTRAFRQHGLTALLDHRQGGNRARLKPHQIEAVQNQLHRYTPAQIASLYACPDFRARPVRRRWAVLDTPGPGSPAGT